MDTIFIPNENDFRRWIKEALKEYLDTYFGTAKIPHEETATSESEEPLLSRKEIAGLFKVSLVIG